MTKDFAPRPDARLVRLHAGGGDPHARLASALAALEGADWGLLLAGEMSLARQLASLIGAGTLRVDGRVDIGRHALAEAGLAVTDLHGDLSGARAVWLFEPDRALFDRARRAGVQVIVDGTLAPGGDWLSQGADFVVYRNSVTLTGHHGQPLAALFGLGTEPTLAAQPPADLAVALAVRDVATLPLRLARAARTVSNLADHLGASVRPAGPTALLLAPDAAADTLAPLGGLLAAARHVPDGLLLTPGLEDTEQVLTLLREGVRPTAPTEGRGGHWERERPRRERDQNRSDQNRGEWNRGDQSRERRPSRPEREDRRPPRPDRPTFGRPTSDRPQPEYGQVERQREKTPEPQGQPAAELERFTFEAPAPVHVAPDPAATFQPLPTHSEGEKTWEPEIVFSNLEHAPVPLTHTVSSGPDAAPLSVIPPLTEEGAAEGSEEAAEENAEATQPQAEASEAEAQPEATPPAALLAPDLPATPAESGDADGPAADLTEEQAAIYARLREWRNAEAKRQEISRFIVASNASLAEIARRVPYTLDDLAAVRGMGPARLSKYGEKILEVVRG